VLNCKGCLDYLCDYLDGALSAPERAEFDRHTERCRNCRILCQTTRQTLRLYKTVPCHTIPPDVQSRLMAAVETRFIARRR
jgi:anti-sigma factor RsiW